MSFIYFKRSHAAISSYDVLLLPRHVLNLINNEDLDEILHNVTFHLGLYCLPRDFQ